MGSSAEYVRAHAVEIAAYQKAYKQRNSDRLKEARRTTESKEKNRVRARRYWWKNRAACLAKRKAFYEQHPDRREQRNARERERQRIKKVEIRSKVRDRLNRDPNFKLRVALRTRIARALKCRGVPKSDRTANLVGCTMEFLRQRIEKLFLPGMSWANHGMGNGKWNIDHIMPCARFDLTDPEQQRACFHYSNLQPLWWLDNIRKRDSIPLSLIENNEPGLTPLVLRTTNISAFAQVAA